jgi:hypothetical protein
MSMKNSNDTVGNRPRDLPEHLRNVGNTENTAEWDVIGLRILQWVGNLMRTKDERVTKTALTGYTEGRKPFGRPRGRWLDSVDRDGKRTFIDHCHWVETKLQLINTISYHITYHITLTL